MKISVTRADVNKRFNRDKYYTQTDITNQVVMPIVDIERLDSTLDTSSITLINRDKDPLKPFTRIKISVEENGETTNIYRLVYTDVVEKLTYKAPIKYKHSVELIEPTKWLERFDIDNTTITNFLAFLYQESEGLIKLQSEAVKTKQEVYIIGLDPEGFFNGWRDGRISRDVYIGTTRLDDVYSRFDTFNHSLFRRDIKFSYFEYHVLFFGSTKTVNVPLVEFTATDEDGVVTDLLNLSSDFIFSKVQTYTFRQKYKYERISNTTPPLTTLKAEVVYEWKTRVIANEQELEKYPQRYTIKQVCNTIIDKACIESTVMRNGIDSRLFQLDPVVAEKLDKITSPEFTFTQNTLFGMLSQVGEAIHAIPRLVPFNIESGDKIDDMSEWSVITFDFLGQKDGVVEGEAIALEQTQNGDNYTTSFVANVQNSFQTNNADYISLTEPYGDGFVSTRTEDASFEISDNSAVIKTSRPIHRIVELKLWYKGDEQILDITSHVKESADYSILYDYADRTCDYSSYKTKQTAIYYTRGDNVIRGLDFVTPSKFSLDGFSISNAISNIVGLYSGKTIDLDLRDLMFSIKYVPFYDLKVKQYKPLITEDSGSNTLFYNQNQTQSVDIESLGENMKGALMRTANIEPTKTELFNGLSNMIKVGQVTSDGYYAYEVRKEITNTNVKATTTFSKDWNKLNEFVGIKKNYREWEISERESVEHNPCYNEFCIISNELDVNKDYHTENNKIEIISQRQVGVQNNLHTYAFKVADISDYQVEDIIYYGSSEFYEIKSINLLTNEFTLEISASSELYSKLIAGQTYELYTKKLIPGYSNEDVEQYKTELNKNGGFLSNRAINQVYMRLSNLKTVSFTIKSIDEFSEYDNNYRFGFYFDEYSQFVDGDKFYYKNEEYRVDEVDHDYGYIGTSVNASSQLYKAIQDNEIIVIQTNQDLRAIDWVFGKTESQEYDGNGKYVTVRKSFLLPCACFSFGNSIVLNFGAKDNYALNTFSRLKNTYAIEEYIEYANKYGKVENLYLCFGSKRAKLNGFNTFENAKETSKELYKFDERNLDESRVMLDYRDYSFNVNKDNRQKMNFTNQLHFVTDSTNIWIGKGLAQSMPFTGNTENNILKFVTFSRKPDKFLTEIDTTIFVEEEMPSCQIDYDLKYIKYEPKAVENDCVGYGLIDNQNRIVLYFDKELNAGENTDDIYFQFRTLI